MEEYVNTATNHKVLAVKWSGTPLSTIQINPNSLFKYHNDYDPNEYLSHSLKTLDVMKNKPLGDNVFTHVSVKTHINNYIIVRIKDIINRTLIDDGDEGKIDIVKPNVFQKWYKKLSQKNSNRMFLIEDSHSNNIYDVPDPVHVVGASANICKAYKDAVKQEWKGGNIFLKSIKNFN